MFRPNGNDDLFFLINVENTTETTTREEVTEVKVSEEPTPKDSEEADKW